MRKVSSKGSSPQNSQLTGQQQFLVVLVYARLTSASSAKELSNWISASLSVQNAI
jgi:hypothetical protein